MSSKRHVRRKQCTGKVTHATMQAAEEAARASSRKFKTRLSAYKCRFCGGYHVGHTPAKLRRKLQQMHMILA